MRPPCLRTVEEARRRGLWSTWDIAVSDEPTGADADRRSLAGRAVTESARAYSYYPSKQARNTIKHANLK